MEIPNSEVLTTIPDFEKESDLKFNVFIDIVVQNSQNFLSRDEAEKRGPGNGHSLYRGRTRDGDGC